MAEFAVSGFEVEFQPSSGWRWQGWSGRLPIRPRSRGLTDAGRDAAVAEDLERLASRLIGKQYVADGYDSTPGAITWAEIKIDRGTLSQIARIGGGEVVLVTTRGRFRVAAAPAFNGVPLPDPLTARSGTFSIQLGNIPVLNDLS